MVTEYKDNEAYEKDRATVLSFAENFASPVPFSVVRKTVAELLKQSKWVGNTEDIRPLPVVRDGDRKPVEKYTWLEWIAKLNEELDEVKYAVSQFEDRIGDSDFDEEDGEHFVAEELQDLITVATSMMNNYLGYNEIARDKICTEVNEKNRKRGYFSNN